MEFDIRRSFVIVVVIALLVVASYFFFAGVPTRTSPAADTPSPSLSPTPEDPNLPKVTFEVKGKSILLVKWRNLSEDIAYLTIYRKKITGGAWANWKKINLEKGETTGSRELQIEKGDDIYNYSFSAGGSNSSGQTVWTSPAVQAVPYTEPPPPPPPTQASPPPPEGTPPPAGSGGSSTSPQASPPPPAPAPPPSPTPSPPSASPPPEGYTGPISYYPSGAAVAASSTDNFWVLHVNQRIEVGWQNIPPNANQAVVYRSSNSGSPWNFLMQQNPPSDPYFIRLVDDTLNDPYYYKLDLLQNGQLVTTYGPVLLTPL